MTITIKIDSLDTLFSKFIRMRAINRVHGCERCGTYKKDYKQLQCSHFNGRAKKSTRWDEDNAVGLCFGCHQYFTGHPLEHIQWFIAHLDEGKFNMLQGRMRIIQKPDKAALTLYYQLKIKELEDA